MNTFKILFIALFTITLVACSDSDSSTEDSSTEATVTTESGVTVSFDTNETTVDEIFEFFYDLGGDEFTGTIRWGDNTETRVRGSGNARHIYRGDGEVTISIQIDGGESERVGRVQVIAVALDSGVDSVASSNSTFPQTGQQRCDVSGTLTLDSSSGIRYRIVRTVTTTGFFDIEFVEDGVTVLQAEDNSCPRGVSFVDSRVPDTTGLTLSHSATDLVIMYNAN